MSATATENATLDWVVVTGHNRKKLGAVGFLGSDAVAIISFFHDRDLDMDGSVSWKEEVFSRIPFDQTGRGVTKVAMQARVEDTVVLRDPSFQQMAGKIFVNFASSLAMQGVYIAYFQRGVSAVAGGVATRITAGMVQGFVVRKGFETAVKKAFMAAVKP